MLCLFPAQGLCTCFVFFLELPTLQTFRRLAPFHHSDLNQVSPHRGVPRSLHLKWLPTQVMLYSVLLFLFSKSIALTTIWRYFSMWLLTSVLKVWPRTSSFRIHWEFPRIACSQVLLQTYVIRASDLLHVGARDLYFNKPSGWVQWKIKFENSGLQWWPLLSPVPRLACRPQEKRSTSCSA